MAPDFGPTYKKKEGRLASDLVLPDWVDKIYRVQFKEPFYKGGRVKERVPGWCDRIQYRSKESVSGRLMPEVGGKDSQGRPFDNYRTCNHTLLFSDHSAVFSTFELCVDARRASPSEEERHVVINVTDVKCSVSRGWRY